MEFTVGLPDGAVVLFGSAAWAKHPGEDGGARRTFARAQLMVLTDDAPPEGLVVKTAELPTGLVPAQRVRLVGLRGVSWSFNGRSGTTFWASGVEAVDELAEVAR